MASLDNLRYCFVRGASAVGAPQQPGWDVVIPFILSNGKISALLFTSKNRSVALDYKELEDWHGQSLEQASNTFQHQP